MQLVREHNKEVQFLLRVTDSFSINAWIDPLKDKKVTNAINAFSKKC